MSKIVYKPNPSSMPGKVKSSDAANAVMALMAGMNFDGYYIEQTAYDRLPDWIKAYWLGSQVEDSDEG